MMFKKIMRNDEGNISLFLLGILGIVMIMFLFVLNLGKVFAVKEHANTTAQQASLTATSVFYQGIDRAIDRYKYETLDDSIDRKIGEKERKLQSDHRYTGWSLNEIHIEAVDQVLSEELQNGFGNEKLRGILVAEMNQIIPEMIEKARESILENGGTLDGAEMLVFKNNRVYVRSAATMKATSYQKYFKGFKENIYQEAAGPEIDFLSNLNWGNRTETID